MDQQVKAHAATGTTAVAWILEQLYKYGPSWSLVPPILVGLASLVGAINALRSGEQERRHKEALFKLQLAKTIPQVEGLDPRRN